MNNLFEIYNLSNYEFRRNNFELKRLSITFHILDNIVENQIQSLR